MRDETAASLRKGDLVTFRSPGRGLVGTYPLASTPHRVDDEYGVVGYYFYLDDPQFSSRQPPYHSALFEEPHAPERLAQG